MPRFGRNDKPNIDATLLSLQGALATWQSDLKGRCEGEARGNLFLLKFNNITALNLVLDKYEKQYIFIKR